MFANTRKLAQQTSQRLITGHCALVAWSTLKHAGVLDAIAAIGAEGLDPKVHAVRRNMAPDILLTLLDYLAATGLIAITGTRAGFTADGRALFDHDDGVIDLVRAYQPSLAAAEHLLAKLKTPVAAGGGMRKSEALLESRARRQGPELYPAIEALVREHRFSHLLDVQCGNGELLLEMGKRIRGVVGVGIGADDAACHRANTAFAEAAMEKRLIAVPGAAAEVLGDTRRSFERIGISKQLWRDLDLVILPMLFSDMVRDAESVSALLAAARRHFPRAGLLLIEPVEGARMGKNYYAPELSLFLRLARSPMWTGDQWREALAKARLPVSVEAPLGVDGLTLFLSKPAPAGAKAAAAGAKPAARAAR
ncbi:MAG TPA: hypothetical protein VH253_05590 [Phycisphaerae bacterium]|nr:hypothetical protein [Phycisphaerae bacterium]